MTRHTIVVLTGDQTGQELLAEALQILDPSVTGLDLQFRTYDLSLDNRRATQNKVVYDAAAAIREHRLGLKAAAITPETKGDAGSPNAILREQMGAQVILRTGRRIPRVRPIGGVHSPISVVRMAVGDAYGAAEWREGEPGSLDEIASRTEQISRRVCRAVVEYAFQHARRTGARIFGGPKYTVSPVYEGMFKEEMDTGGGPLSRRALQTATDRRHVRPAAVNVRQPTGDSGAEPRRRSALRHGVADVRIHRHSESLVIAMDEGGKVQAVMAEAPHGTAPNLEGKNVANPMAMILAGASLLSHIESNDARLANRAMYESTLEAVYDGFATADLGGPTRTHEFTSEVIRRVRTKVEYLVIAHLSTFLRSHQATRGRTSMHQTLFSRTLSVIVLAIVVVALVLNIAVPLTFAQDTGRDPDRDR